MPYRLSAKEKWPCGEVAVGEGDTHIWSKVLLFPYPKLPTPSFQLFVMFNI